MIPLHRTEASSRRGQALVEMLILLPVILLLLLAVSDLGKLFVISGKSEIAARYSAFRWYRPGSFEPVGGLYEEPVSDAAAAGQIGAIFFEGSLEDSESSDEDVGYYPLSGGSGGDFEYTIPEFSHEYWNAMLSLFNQGGEILPVAANRATFTYDLPFFPYGKTHPMRETENTGPFWGDLEDPLGSWPLFTVKGDLVFINEAFYGDGGEAFLDMLISYGIIQDTPELVLEFGIGLLVLLFLLGGG